MKIEATTRKEEQLLALATKRGLCVVPVGVSGAVRIVGRDVDVLANRLSTIDLRDLSPNHQVGAMHV
jgi:hypothetical protein